VRRAQGSRPERASEREAGSSRGVKATLRESPWLPSPSFPPGNWREGRGAAAGGNQRSHAGTRCNSLGSGARSKPSRWGPNHEDGTRRVGWHRPAEGGATLREWTRAGDVGRAPSERAVCLGDEATRHGGGSAATGAGLVRGAQRSRRGSWVVHRSHRSVGAQQCAPAPQSIRPAKQGNLGRPARRLLRLRLRVPSSRAGAWEGAGFATCAGNPHMSGGRARARPGKGGVDVSGWCPDATGVRAPAGDRDVRTHRVTEPGWTGPEQAEKLTRAVARNRILLSHDARTGWSGAGKPWRRLSKERSPGGKAVVPSSRHCTGEATPRGTHPTGSVGGP